MSLSAGAQARESRLDGPLWTYVEQVSWDLSHNVVWAVRLLKLVALFATLLSAALVWLILRAVRPEVAFLGAVAYLWNPLVAAEGPWEGHNDALMVMFVLAALWLFVRRRTGLAALALTLGILVKYVPALCLPALGLAAWQAGFRQFRRFLLGVLAGVAVGAAAWSSLWVGIDTFTGVRQSAEAGPIGSTPTAVLWVASHLLPHGTARIATTVLVWAAFLAYAGRQTLRARSRETLLRVTAYVVLTYVLLASAAYWPWYMLLPVALLALNVDDWRSLVLLVGVTLSARLVAPLDDLAHASTGLTGRDQTVGTVVLGVALPLTLLALSSVRRAAPREPAESSRLV